jgi:hypothetical protein
MATTMHRLQISLPEWQTQFLAEHRARSEGRGERRGGGSPARPARGGGGPRNPRLEAPSASAEVRGGRGGAGAQRYDERML